jgi:hypothetical protein
MLRESGATTRLEPLHGVATADWPVPGRRQVPAGRVVPEANNLTREAAAVNPPT